MLCSEAALYWRQLNPYSEPAVLRNLLLPPKNRAARPASETCLYLYGPIGPYDDWGDISAKSVASALSQMPNDATLTVYVNSVGGSVFEGVAIYQQLRRFKGKKIIQVDSLAASIASIITMAGDEIHMGFNAQMMIHDPEGGAYGRESDLRKYADLLKSTKETLVDTYVARTKQSRSTISSWMGEETWLRAEDALKFGFADKIVNANVDADVDDRSKVILAKYRHAPKDIAPSAELVRRAMVANMKMATMRNRTSGTPA